MTFRLARSRVAQLVMAVLFGGFLGVWRPSLATQMKPLSDLFIASVGLVTPVVIFVLICSSVARMRADGTTLRLGFKALAYWQLMSLLSLACGLSVASLLQPGVSTMVTAEFSPAGMAPIDIHFFAQIPALLLAAFAQSIILKVLLAAFLAGLLLGRIGERGMALRQTLDAAVGMVFRIMHVIVFFAPLAAFGAIAFAIGKHGAGAAIPLLKFVAVAYVACLLFIVLVMTLMVRLAGVSLLRLIVHIREELLLVASTGSSVAALPRLIDKLEAAGCDSQLVRLILTAGYNFNLNGSNLYLGVAVLFLAQLVHIDLSAPQLLTLLLVSLFTSMGSTSVAGSAFITLTATLSVVQIVPLEAIGILVGVERLMKCRSLTNVLGNCVACLVLARWQGAQDRARLMQVLG
ncbi:sodium:dicarboxylate symporter [Pseudomonas daroniae]|nr:sodium:dicarboxylate symporter [Pseudomonas daroniae]